MFEAAELGQTISKRKYEAELPKLRAAVLKAHFALKDTKVPVIVIVSGADGAGTRRDFLRLVVHRADHPARLWRDQKQ